MPNETPIEIRDNENQKHILVQVNLEKGNTQVLSNFSAWENISYLCEALGATYQQCVSEGISKNKTKKAIEEYLKKVFEAYDFV